MSRDNDRPAPHKRRTRGSASDDAPFSSARRKGISVTEKNFVAPQDRPEPTPQRFRKRPVVIDAVHYIGGGNVEPRGAVPDWLWDALAKGTAQYFNGGDPLRLRTLEGYLTVSPGDWIIRGIHGELYPCKPDIFDATYEPVAVPARAHQEETNDEMPLARSETTEIRDRQPAAVTEAGHQKDSAGTRET